MKLYFFITCTNLFSPYITFHSAERNKLNTVLHMLSTLFFHHDGEMQLQLVRSFLLQCLKKSERSQPVVSYLFPSSSPFPIPSQHSLSHSLSRALSLPTRVMPDAVARPRGRGWPRMLRLMDWSRLAAARPAPVAAQGGQAGASGPGGQPRGVG